MPELNSTFSQLLSILNKCLSILSLKYFDFFPGVVGGEVI